VSTALVAIIAAQLAFLVASFLFLVIRRRYDDHAHAKLQRERQALTEGIAAALEVPPKIDRFRTAVANVRFDTLVLVLYDFSGRVSGAPWERLVSTVRSTPGPEAQLRRHVTSRLWWKRLLGARALAVMGSIDDLPYARKLVADPHPAVKLAAISIARRVRDERLLTDVLDQAIVSRRVVRGYMFDTLTSARRELAPILQRRLREPKSVFELRDLIRLAGTLAKPELLEPILRLTTHEDAEVRGGAARALGNFPHGDSRAALLRLIQDPAWQVRTRAATSLGAIRAKEALDLLRRALRDDNWWVRLRAALALRQFGEPGVEQLNRASQDDDRFASEMATYILDLTDAAVADYLA
jgi:HEAT repeat protein